MPNFLGTLTLTALAAMGVWAEEGKEHEGATRELYESILAKEGISLGGEFRSRYLHSSIGGPAANPARRSEETAEFTSVDFDIKARPNTLTQGRLIFRLHQDWRNFFSDISNPIFTRWISIDGSAKGMFSYNAGDFREQYSPLTLYTPELDILYEPELFAKDIRMAMDERFLGNNDRLLQGVNLNFDAEVVPMFKELHLNVLGSRLRNVETNIQNGNKVTSFIETSPVEKFLGAANAQAVFLKGLSAGGSFLRIFDKKGSYSGTGSADTAAQSTDVVSGRLAADVSPILGTEIWNVGFSGEYALSRDTESSFGPLTDSTAAHGPLTSVVMEGTALRAGLHGRFAWKKIVAAGASLDFIGNDRNFRNELAQSPSFVGERILNSENDSLLGTREPYYFTANHYSTFDAMYHHVFKFTPSTSTNLWHKAPFSKNSYGNSIYTQTELSALAAAMDPSVQLIMPFGPATPNRTGLNGEVKFSLLGERAEIRGVFTDMEEMEGVPVDSIRILPKTRFTRAGLGGSVDVGSLTGWRHPVTLSASIIRSRADNDGLAGDSVYTSRKVASEFVNAGLNFQFWKRAALLAGYQRIDNTFTTSSIEMEQVQSHAAAGLEYKLADGAYVIGSLGQMKVVFPAESQKDFSQLLTNLSLRVRF